MSWVAVALSAYFVLALANLVDKFLVEKVVGSARAYTFLACILGLLVFVLSPWFLTWPGWGAWLANLLLGLIFALALLLLYASLRRGEASRALVIVGGSTPIFSIPLSLVFLHDSFSGKQLLSILFLVIGVAIIAILPKTKSGFWERLSFNFNLKHQYKTSSVLLALAAGFVYAVFFVGSKLVYQHQDFLSAFLWMRLGSAIAALFILFSRRARREIKALFARHPDRGKKQGLVVGNQVLGALGFILQNYAIYLGPVALVNALQGVQYAWIILIGSLVSWLAPKILKENISWPVLLQKSSAVAIIGVGLYLLAFI